MNLNVGILSKGVKPWLLVLGAPALWPCALIGACASRQGVCCHCFHVLKGVSARRLQRLEPVSDEMRATLAI